MSLDSALQDAVNAGTLLADAQNNIAALLASSENPIYRACIDELVQGGHFEELNDRFFQRLKFGDRKSVV
jgi:hypothetical protein